MHLPSAEQDLVSPTVQDIGGRPVAERLVIAAEVVPEVHVACSRVDLQSLNELEHDG